MKFQSYRIVIDNNDKNALISLRIKIMKWVGEAGGAVRGKDCKESFFQSRRGRIKNTGRKCWERENKASQDK